MFEKQSPWQKLVRGLGFALFGGVYLFNSVARSIGGEEIVGKEAEKIALCLDEFDDPQNDPRGLYSDNLSFWFCVIKSSEFVRSLSPNAELTYSILNCFTSEMKLITPRVKNILHMLENYGLNTAENREFFFSTLLEKSGIMKLQQTERLFKLNFVQGNPGECQISPPLCDCLFSEAGTKQANLEKLFENTHLCNEICNIIESPLFKQLKNTSGNTKATTILMNCCSPDKTVNTFRTLWKSQAKAATESLNTTFGISAGITPANLNDLLPSSGNQNQAPLKLNEKSQCTTLTQLISREKGHPLSSTPSAALSDFASVTVAPT